MGKGKNTGFIISSESFTPDASCNNETSKDRNPDFCGIPLATGFITPTSMPRLRRQVAIAAVITVLPTPVSVPVIKYDFTANNYRCHLIIYRIIIDATGLETPTCIVMFGILIPR